VLQARGFVVVSQKGSHTKCRHPGGHTAIVPHPKKELPIGATRANIRQSGLSTGDFEI
jgi:predicted RNA binding protein YcfA (HicA-like mRNA interferase family)